MKNNILIVIFSLLASCSFAQAYYLEAIIQNLPDGIVYLSSYQRTEYILRDSTRSGNGSFYFQIPDDIKAAMYRLDFTRPQQSGTAKDIQFIEFIWAGESFQIFADYKNLEASVTFENSTENNILRKFRNFEILYEKKMTALNPLIERYPENDDFYRNASAYFERIQEERDSVIVQLSADNQGLFAGKIIGSYRSPLLSPANSSAERISFLKEHFFDLAPINTGDLLFAPVYTRKIIEYLRLYRDGNFTYSDQENAFIKAVDIIMANVSGDPELRTFVVEYLLEGFKTFGMEKIQTYIVDTYVDETCATDIVNLAVERALDYRRMAVGQIAPDILIRSYDNTLEKLSEMETEYTLVLFWASYCEHCAKLMPELREWYDTERPANIDIFAVSIDTVKSEWMKYSEVEKPPWINTHEALGWRGKSAEEYNIYATPTMFILDRQRKIIAKPYTFRELKREVGRL